MNATGDINEALKTNKNHPMTTWTQKLSNATRAPLIVEKVKIDLKTGQRQELFALCFSEPKEIAETYSLTYEGYITRWTPNRESLNMLT